MNYKSASTQSKGIGLILTGTTIAIMGVLLDAYWTEQYWANQPPYSTGPILMGTAGLFIIFPVGVLISILGGILIVHNSRRWPRVKELLER